MIFTKAQNVNLTKTSGDATVLSFKYSKALCWISASEFLRLLSLRKIWGNKIYHITKGYSDQNFFQ